MNTSNVRFHFSNHLPWLLGKVLGLKMSDAQRTWVAQSGEQDSWFRLRSWSPCLLWDCAPCQAPHSAWGCFRFSLLLPLLHFLSQTNKSILKKKKMKDALLLQIATSWTPWAYPGQNHHAFSLMFRKASHWDFNDTCPGWVNQLSEFYQKCLCT